MSNTILWTIEERFWTGQLEDFSDTLSEDCIMALPAPAGLLAGRDLRESLGSLPRWSAVEMGERTLVEVRERNSFGGGECCILAYRAHARRGESEYAALCTSTYVRTDARWRLAQHQQTPLAN